MYGSQWSSNTLLPISNWLFVGTMLTLFLKFNSKELIMFSFFRRFSFLSILASLSLSFVTSYAQNSTVDFNGCVVNAQIRDITSKITNKEYELIINLPYSYYKDTLKTYPVVYICDGFYDFALFTSIYGNQIYDKTINECFVVHFVYSFELAVLMLNQIL